MTNDILMEHHNGGGVGTKVNEHTTATLLNWCEHSISQSKRSKIELSNLYACYLKTSVEFLIMTLALKDIKEITVKTLALYSYRLCLQQIVSTILLHLYVKNLLLRILHRTVLIHHVNNELLGNRHLIAQFLSDSVEVRVY